MPTVIQQHYSDITMTTVDIPEKQHRKLKKEALKRNIDLKDLVSEKLSGLIIIAILFISGLGLALGTGAYAEEVNLPLEEPYDDTFCSFVKEGNHVTFSCYWRWYFPDYIMQGIENDTTIPSQLTDLPQHNLDLADKIRLLLERGAPPEIIPDDSFVEDDVPTEPLTKEEREIEAAIETLAECRTGLGAWAAYQEDEAIQNYADKTRWEFSIRDNLSKSYTIKQILLAIEECDIMKVYADMNLIGAYELNKVLADLAGVDYLGRTAEHPLATKVTDQSDAMVETDPVTPKDIEQERTEAEELRDKLIEERVFEDPDADFTGINRGGQPLGLKCQVHGQPAPVGLHPTNTCPLSLYDEHILKNWQSITYDDVLELQCKHFLYIYLHKVGTHEFPVWLNHCVPKVVRNID